MSCHMSSFLCAVSKKVNNERKEFHFGKSDIWDGETIRKTVNGGSNLYILEVQVRLGNFIALTYK